jgi:hypothetical protein
MGNPNWVKGVSGNPAGRPPGGGTGYTAMLRKRVPFAEIVELKLAIARGEPMVRDQAFVLALYKARAACEPDPPRPPHAEVVYPTVTEQLRAAELLVSWGFQRPAEKLEISTAPEVDLSSLSDDELEQYERLLAKAQVREVGPSAAAGRVIDTRGVEVPALPPGR